MPLQYCTGVGFSGTSGISVYSENPCKCIRGSAHSPKAATDFLRSRMMTSSNQWRGVCLESSGELCVYKASFTKLCPSWVWPDHFQHILHPLCSSGLPAVASSIIPSRPARAEERVRERSRWIAEDSKTWDKLTQVRKLLRGAKSSVFTCLSPIYSCSIQTPHFKNPKADTKYDCTDWIYTTGNQYCWILKESALQTHLIMNMDSCSE